MNDRKTVSVWVGVIELSNHQSLIQLRDNVNAMIREADLKAVDPNTITTSFCVDDSPLEIYLYGDRPETLEEYNKRVATAAARRKTIAAKKAKQQQTDYEQYVKACAKVGAVPVSREQLKP